LTIFLGEKLNGVLFFFFGFFFFLGGGGSTATLSNFQTLFKDVGSPTTSSASSTLEQINPGLLNPIGSNASSSVAMGCYPATISNRVAEIDLAVRSPPLHTLVIPAPVARRALGGVTTLPVPPPQDPVGNSVITVCAGAGVTGRANAYLPVYFPTPTQVLRLYGQMSTGMFFFFVFFFFLSPPIQEVKGFFSDFSFFALRKTGKTENNQQSRDTGIPDGGAAPLRDVPERDV
jgi:hypothetical protein